MACYFTQQTFRPGMTFPASTSTSKERHRVGLSETQNSTCSAMSRKETYLQFWSTSSIVDKRRVITTGQVSVYIYAFSQPSLLTDSMQCWLFAFRFITGPFGSSAEPLKCIWTQRKVFERHRYARSHSNGICVTATDSGCFSFSLCIPSSIGHTQRKIKQWV